jgi:Tfp pilus assembly protein PilX
MIEFFVRRFQVRDDGSRDEAGVAMIIAITVVMLMTMIPLVVFTQAIQQLPLARHDQDHESALAAAEAGVDDYLGRLATNANYWTYSATNPPTPANAAFTGWVQVPGNPTTSNQECYRYKPNTTQTAATGVVYLTSSGKRLTTPTGTCANASSPGVIRTVSLGVRRQGFLDYLWLTDYEINDPALSGPPNPAACRFHQYEWNTVTGSGYGPSDLGDCQAVTWSNLSVLNGPVHSNDGLYVCGSPTFNGRVDTYYNSTATSGSGNTPKFGGPGKVYNTCSGGTALAPNFDAGDPSSGTFLQFPAANNSIKTQANGATGGIGCLYTGPTTITLLSTGKMNVTSPKTRSTNSGCTPGSGRNLPVNGVIYVQNVPSSSSDPNYSSCFGSSCIGDVNISGVLNGQLTVAAADDIDITDDLTYHQYPGGTDVLGLVADNDVAVVHARGADVTDDITIDAAILSLNHSFYVQNWDSGGNDPCSGTHPCAIAGAHSINLNGVISQKYRGPVGTFSSGTGTLSTGYNKNYTYDSRLKYLSPPFFLNPTQSAWIRNSYSEIPPKPIP